MNKTIVCLVLCASGALPALAEERKPVRTYTNEDLARVSAYRAETGGDSRPGPVPSPAPAPREAGSRRGEEYWRREAERLRDRIRPLRQEADALRFQLEEARRSAAGRPTQGRSGAHAGKSHAGPSAAALEQRLRAVEAEIREREDLLEERARRGGALPGWLR